MSTSVDTSAIDRLIVDAHEAFASFRKTFLTDAFVADPYQDLECLRQQSSKFRESAKELGLSVFAEIVRCLESSLEGLIQNHCELSDSLLILIHVAEDALEGHKNQDISVPALVQRANIEYRRMRNLPKNGDSRAVKKAMQRVEMPGNDTKTPLGTTVTPANASEAPSASKPGTDLGTENVAAKTLATDSWKKEISTFLPDQVTLEKAVRAQEDSTGTDLAAALLNGIDDLDLELDSTAASLDTAPASIGINVPTAQKESQSAKPRSTSTTTPAPAVELSISDDPELTAVFLEEVTDHIRHLNEIVTHLNENPGDVAELNDARRRMHSLKGSAGVMGWQHVATLAHRTEDLLERLAERTFPALNEGIELFQYCMDALSELVSGTPCDELLELIYEQFNALGLSDPGLLPTQTQATLDAVANEFAVATPTKQTTSPILFTHAATDDLSEVELDNLEEISLEMREIFMEEAEDHLRIIYASFAEVETQGPTLELIQTIRRSVHTLKGAAGAVGFRAAGKWCHRMEDVLEQLQDEGQLPSAKTIAILYRTSDAIQDLVQGHYDEAPMRQRLAALLRDYNALANPTDVSTGPSITPSTITPDLATAANDIDVSAVQIDDQNEIAPELREIFTEEVEEHLRIIYMTFAELEHEGTTPGRLQEIRRSVHTLKGAAGTVGFRVVATWCHRMEDILDRMNDGAESASASTIALLYRTTDAIQDLVHQRGNETELRRRLAKLLVDHETRFDTPAPAPTLPVENDEVRFTDPARVELDDLASIAPEMLEVFTEEADDHLRAIYADFAQIESDGATLPIIRDIRRSIHTLKGAAGTVGFRVVSQWSHRMEDILDQLQEGQSQASPATVQLLYRTTDAIHDLVHGDTVAADLRQRLADLYRDYQSHHESEVAAPQAPLRDSVESRRTSTPKQTTKREIKVDVDLVDFEAVANSARAVKPRAVEPKPSRKASSSQHLRVPIERLDSLAQTVSELVLNRTAFEQKMMDLIRFVAENQASVQRLRGISYNLESDYGVKLLGSQRHFGPSAGGPASLLNRKNSNQSEEFDTLEFDRYGEFHVLTRSLAETTTDIDTVGNELRALLGDFDTLLNRQGRLAREAQTRIMGIRMVPLAMLASRLQRTVRVVAQEQGKNVNLEIIGENVELDKLVLEELSDPLIHLLRNGVDHGIELPDQREAKGKPAQATIRIHAYHQGTQVVVQIEDDGRGLDYEKIRNIAIQNGVLSPSEADCSTEEDLRNLIYVPGFSTASKVSEISGRGVGMDVVRDKVQKLKGTIDTASMTGKGTTFTIRLPMTMAITRALMISANQETFALPIQVVQQILRIERKQLRQLDDDSVIRIKDRVYPVIRLADRLNLRQRADASSDMVPTLLVSAGGRTAAIVVDRIISSRDIVVKSLGNHLQYLPGMIGATLMGDGTVVPILDAVDLVGVRLGRMHAVPRVTPVLPEPAEPAPVDRPIKVMIVDDSVSVRRVMSNLVRNAGMLDIVAKDGVDALGMLQSDDNNPDIFLLDIEMPRMDGFELLATLRGQLQYRETPIVMISSRAGEKHRAKAAELGASHYLTKPFRDQELLETIRTLTRHEALALV